MTFDKSKVCVAGLHDVPVGTKGYFSGEIRYLRGYLKDDDKDMYGTIMERNQDGGYKIIEKNGDTNYYRFFYPCEEKATYRPYATIEEAQVMKGKWIRSKDGKTLKQVVLIYYNDMTGVLFINTYSANSLFEHFVMDETGEPVGVEE